VASRGPRPADSRSALTELLRLRTIYPSPGQARCGPGSVNGYGDGSELTRAVATPIKGLTGTQAVVAGNSHACALKEDGTVWCWGSNQSHAAGAPTVVPDLLFPARVAGIGKVHVIAATAARCVGATTSTAPWETERLASIAPPVPR
jgi:alpha-tubulin suppressor-like RCC1 family protein